MWIQESFLPYFVVALPFEDHSKAEKTAPRSRETTVSVSYVTLAHHATIRHNGAWDRNRPNGIWTKRLRKEQ